MLSIHACRANISRMSQQISKMFLAQVTHPINAKTPERETQPNNEEDNRSQAYVAGPIRKEGR